MCFLKLAFVLSTLSEKINLTRKRIFFHFFSTKNDFEGLILKHTVVSRNHLTPELKLRLITPECELWHCKYSDTHFPNDPFWAIYWPGGQALGRYILDNKLLFHQKNVLEIGSGSGACALAAAKSGAQYVLANDIDPVSICAIETNAKLNDLKVYTCEHNLIGSNIDSLNINVNNEILQPEWNVILVGDMFYDLEVSNKLFCWLLKLVEKDKLVLVGDPGRLAWEEIEDSLNSGCLMKIAEYELHNKEHNGFSSSSVFKIKSNHL